MNVCLYICWRVSLYDLACIYSKYQLPPWMKPHNSLITPVYKFVRNAYRSLSITSNALRYAILSRRASKTPWRWFSTSLLLYTILIIIWIIIIRNICLNTRMRCFKSFTHMSHSNSSIIYKNLHMKSCLSIHTYL